MSSNSASVNLHDFCSPFSNDANVSIEQRLVKDRRRRPTPMISRYLFIGSRRANRRLSDPQTRYYVDRPCLGLILIALAIIVLGGLDAFFTHELLKGSVIEWNPLMNFFLSLGWACCLFFKFVLTVAGLFVLLVHQNFFKMQRIMGSVSFLYILLIAYEVVLLIHT
jgi:hypothetical protein